ncbi:hypothetical protein CTI14_69250, partial [Methylobacterium radiotolerans]
FQRITPWFDWVVRTYVTKGGGVDHVSEGLAAEYSPRLRRDNELWFQRITPWFDWVVRTYVTKGGGVDHVSEGLAAEY